jgi:hypothetical protein
MTFPDLLRTLDARGVRLSARLVVDAPAGVLTPELCDALAAHKPLLLQRIVREMAWAELSGWRWGPARGDPSPGIDNPGRRPTLDTSALARAAADPEALAERAAIRAESGPTP